MLRHSLPTVRDDLHARLYKSAGIELLNYILFRGGRVGIFAGAVRDTVAAREFGWSNSVPRDWDIGVSNLSREEFHGILREVGGIQNRHGGYKLFPFATAPWEVWRLEDTVGLRLRVVPFSLGNVLRSFVLSCNAISFDIDSGLFCDRGAFLSIARREIGLLDDAIVHDRDTFSAKALSLTFRFPFQLSIDVAFMVRKYLTMGSLLHESSKAYSQLPLLNSPHDAMNSIVKR
jgi:hypothetical protein